MPADQKRQLGLSTEARVVLASAGGTAQNENLRAWVRGELDWPRMAAISLREGAQPVLGRRIRELGELEVSADVAASLRHIERIGEFRQRYLERRLFETLQALTEAGVDVMLLKGVAVAQAVFGDFSQRPMSDIDLLVRTEDVPRAHPVLLAAGWGPRFSSEFDAWYAGMHHLPPLTDTRTPDLQLGLDLHTQLFPEERNPFAFEAADMWRERHANQLLPKGAFVSSLENHLLHSCIHHAWSHRLAGAGWRTFRDVSAIAEQPAFQWTEFVARVERSGAYTPVYWSLTLARSLSGAPVPDEVLEGLRPRRPGIILSVLQRHFEHEAVEAERICPSDRLRRALWIAAMDGNERVRSAAEPDHRPWRRLRKEASEAGEPRPIWNRPALRPSAWAGYLRALVR